MEPELTEQISPQDERAIYQGLLAYNLARLEDRHPRQLGVFLRDEAGKPTAGLIGMTHGNWLSIRYLWVAEPLRGQGVGSRLLEAAEFEALSRGCRYAVVDTFHFQAPAFYERHAYCQVFTLTEYPLTGSRSYYTKRLTRERTEKSSEPDC